MHIILWENLFFGGEIGYWIKIMGKLLEQLSGLGSKIVGIYQKVRKLCLLINSVRKVNYLKSNL